MGLLFRVRDAEGNLQWPRELSDPEPVKEASQRKEISAAPAKEPRRLAS
jgi:hypothetical protein